jgi:hypothetical protein
MVNRILGAVVSSLARLACNSQRGSGVAEAAMLSLLAASGIFATTVITSGDTLMEQLENVVNGSMNRIGGTMEVRGSVIVRASGAPLKAESIEFTLGTFGELQGISTDPASGGMTVSYHDTQAAAANVPYTVRFGSGNNGDTLLDGGELMTVTVRVADLEAIAGAEVMRPGKRWTLELHVPDGPSLEFSRVQPGILSPVMAQR